MGKKIVKFLKNGKGGSFFLLNNNQISMHRVRSNKQYQSIPILSVNDEIQDFYVADNQLVLLGKKGVWYKGQCPFKGKCWVKDENSGAYFHLLPYSFGEMAVFDGKFYFRSADNNCFISEENKLYVIDGEYRVKGLPLVCRDVLSIAASSQGLLVLTKTAILAMGEGLLSHYGSSADPKTLTALVDFSDGFIDPLAEVYLSDHHILFMDGDKLFRFKRGDFCLGIEAIPGTHSFIDPQFYITQEIGKDPVIVQPEGLQLPWWMKPSRIAGNEAIAGLKELFFSRPGLMKEEEEEEEDTEVNLSSEISSAGDEPPIQVNKFRASGYVKKYLQNISSTSQSSESLASLSMGSISSDTSLDYSSQSIKEVFMLNKDKIESSIQSIFELEGIVSRDTPYHVRFDDILMPDVVGIEPSALLKLSIFRQGDPESIAAGNCEITLGSS